MVFLLLIFFMVTTTFTKETHLSVDLPEATGEPVENLFERCERFVLEENADLTDDEMQQAGAQKMFATQVKKAFLKNLRRDIREALNIKTKEVSADELKEAALMAANRTTAINRRPARVPQR